MVMYRTHSSSDSTFSTQSSSAPLASDRRSKVLSIQCVGETPPAGECTPDRVQTGDIVEEIRIGSLILRSPLRNCGVQKQLHSCFKKKVTEIQVRVGRGEFDSAELNACIVPDGRKRQRYVLRAVDDANYAIAFLDRTEAKCLELQASRTSSLHHALTSTLQDGYVSYPWERRMQEILHVANSSCFFSILFLPKALEKGPGLYNDVEDTLARANAWLNASLASGVPINFMNIQTESLLTKISGETASSTVNTSSLSDLPNLANTSLFGFEDYHGIDIGVVRSVRLWYSPIQAEYPVEMDINEGDIKLGFVISRTDEGFIYVSSVLKGNQNIPSCRSGLDELYRDALKDAKLLVISRVNNQEVLPRFVSASGEIRCFDTVSLSQKITRHRHEHVPLLIHLLMWDQTSSPLQRRSSPASLGMSSCPQVQLSCYSNADRNQSLSSSELPGKAGFACDEIEMGLAGDIGGEESFRFHHFAPPDNWL